MTDTKVCYATGHHISNAIMVAVAQGCNGKIVPPTSLLDGTPIVYGFLRGADKIIKQAQWVNRPFYYIDHGYVGHSHYDGYYRVTRSGYQADWGRMRSPYPDDRWRKLGVGLRPWRKSGGFVMVCPPSKAYCDFRGIDQTDWTRVVVSEIARRTDRPIVIREKPRGGEEPNLIAQLQDCWCIVTDSSNAAVEAIIAGVPAVVLGDSIAQSVSWGFDDIESPIWMDREPWAHALAYQQFTLDEMRDGTIWRLV